MSNYEISTFLLIKYSIRTILFRSHEIFMTKFHVHQIPMPNYYDTNSHILNTCLIGKVSNTRTWLSKCGGLFFKISFDTQIGTQSVLWTHVNLEMPPPPPFPFLHYRNASPDIFTLIVDPRSIWTLSGTFSLAFPHSNMLVEWALWLHENICIWTNYGHITLTWSPCWAMVGVITTTLPLCPLYTQCILSGTLIFIGSHFNTCIPSSVPPWIEVRYSQELQKLWQKWLRKKFGISNCLALVACFASYERRVHD